MGGGRATPVREGGDTTCYLDNVQEEIGVNVKIVTFNTFKVYMGDIFSLQLEIKLFINTLSFFDLISPL